MRRSGSARTAVIMFTTANRSGALPSWKYGGCCRARAMVSSGTDPWRTLPHIRIHADLGRIVEERAPAIGPLRTSVKVGH